LKIYDKNTHDIKYLCLEDQEQFSVLESRLIGNIDSHNILRLLAPVGEDGVFRFDITSCDVFSDYLINRKLTRSELVSILAQLKSVITTLEDHMLGDANILLEPEHMYIEKSSRKLRFVPVCQCSGSFSDRLRRLTDTLFLHADLEDPESLRFAAMLMRVSMNENVRMHDLMQLVESRYPELPEKTTGEYRREKEKTVSEFYEEQERREERYQGSSIVVSRPAEELTMRISDEKQHAVYKRGTAAEDPVTYREDDSGLRSWFRDIARGFRERIGEE